MMDLHLLALRLAAYSLSKEGSWSPIPVKLYNRFENDEQTDIPIVCAPKNHSVLVSKIYLSHVEDVHSHVCSCISS